MVAHVLDLGGLQISCPEPTGQRKLEMMHHWCPAVIEAWRPQPADGKVPFLVYQLPSRAPAAAWRDEPVGPAPRQDSERNGLVAEALLELDRGTGEIGHHGSRMVSIRIPDGFYSKLLLICRTPSATKHGKHRRRRASLSCDYCGISEPGAWYPLK